MASSSSSSSSCRISKYDVFLSFRGEDTRNTIVSYLFKALHDKGIVTFKDDERLMMGDSITDELVKAIEDSKFAIVVISENYATSGWCLDELCLIMELRRKQKLIALPIFYRVDPSDVRHQRGTFETALEEHKSSKTSEKVQRWRDALTQVSNLSGRHYRVIEDEAAMIEEMVRDISKRLSHIRPRAGWNIVGMEAQMEELNPMFDVKPEDEVLMIGIWGMGGIGKTTVSEHLYDRFFQRFYPYCFMGSVRHITTQYGKLYLWSKILSEMLSERELLSKKVGPNEIQARLGHQRVLLVLDDVEDVFQLQFLVHKPKDLFGPGSRIIINTRDMGLLNSLRVRTVYKVKHLENEDALKMFKDIAFEGESPPDGYEQLSVRASRLARGLPSAVEALAVHLRGKTTTREWEIELDNFETTPHRNTIQILKISFEGLDEPDKIIFLHIASLFNGEPVARVAALLSHNVSRTSVLTPLDHTMSKITYLAEKSLIDISDDGYISMHVLMEQTGRYIVHQESGYRASNQRALWDPQEICDVLEDNTGTDRIEGMALNICEMRHNLSMRGNVFNEMKNLRFLNFYMHFQKSNFNLELSKDLDLLPRQLRLLQWDVYPLRTLPSGFRAHCLVELNMRYSNLESLWDGTPELGDLRRLDVTGCKNLRRLPDLSKASKLEELITKGCVRLRQFEQSIGGSSGLKKLDLSDCDGLAGILMDIGEKPYGFSERYGRVTLKLPNAKLKLNSLAHVSIEAKINIRLSHYLEGEADHLSFMSDSSERKTTTRQRFDDTVEAPDYSFTSLDISRFNYNEVHTPFLCCCFWRFPHLKELNLINLNIWDIPHNIGDLSSLEKLDLSGNDFEDLPRSMKDLTKLKYLVACNCRYLRAFPGLTQLETLDLSNCINLRSFLELPVVEGDEVGFSLLELGLDNCKNIRSLSDHLSRLTDLRELDLSRHDFEAPPSTIENFPSLETLRLDNCRNLVSVARLPSSLKRLYVHGCESLETLSLSSDHSIEELDIGHCSRLTQDDLITRLAIDRRNRKASPRCACSRPTMSSHELPYMKRLPYMRRLVSIKNMLLHGTTYLPSRLDKRYKKSSFFPGLSSFLSSRVFFLFLLLFLYFFYPIFLS